MPDVQEIPIPAGRADEPPTAAETRLMRLRNPGREPKAGAAALRPEHARSASRLLLKSGADIHVVSPDEILWIGAEGDYMRFHLGGRNLLLRETMSRLERRLDPSRFVRIHRSTIINFLRLRKISPVDAGEYYVHLEDGTRLRLSHAYHLRLSRYLAGTPDGPVIMGRFGGKLGLPEHTD